MRSDTKLNIKDYITIGIFSAISFALMMVAAVMNLTPYTYLFYGVLVSFLGGPVYLLITLKVPKRGAIVIIQSLSGKGAISTGMVVLYVLFLLLQYFVMPIMPRTLAMVISIFAVQFRKLFPTLMVLILITRTTRVSEIIATMTKRGVPQPLAITLAVTFRYFPAVIEEWHYIRDAMRIRRIENTKLNPIKRIVRTMECYMVPIFVSATQMAIIVAVKVRLV